MKRHPLIGERILATAPTSRRREARPLQPRALGRDGLPGLLSGPEIPLGARIISVCDAFDAMTTTRSYAPQLGSEDAISGRRAARERSSTPRSWPPSPRSSSTCTPSWSPSRIASRERPGVWPRPSRTSLARLAGWDAVDVHSPGEACSRGLDDRPRRVARRVTGGVRANRGHRTLDGEATAQSGVVDGAVHGELLGAGRHSAGDGDDLRAVKTRVTLRPCGTLRACIALGSLRTRGTVGTLLACVALWISA